MNQRELSRFAREFEDMKRRLAAVENHAAHLANSSLQSGSIDVHDETGTLVAVLGQQIDGTFGAVAVNGPPPPSPTYPILTPGAGTVTVGWDGMFQGDDGEPDPDIRVPMDGGIVEVHASPGSPFTPSSATIRGAITSLSGGEKVVAVDEGVEWWFCLVFKSPSGRSTVGPQAFATAAEVMTETRVVELASAAGNGTVVVYSLDAPTTQDKPEGSTWFRLDASGNVIGQWRSGGAGVWTPVALSHQVLASIDLGKATVGILAANRVDAAGLTISGSQLSTGVLPGSTAIKTAAGTARVELTAAGFKAYNSSGVNTVAINSDGSASFTGAIKSGSSITGATVTGSTITGGTFQTAATGARVRITPTPVNGRPGSIEWLGDHSGGVNTAGDLPPYVRGSIGTTSSTWEQYNLMVASGLMGAATQSFLSLDSRSSDGSSAPSQATLSADTVWIDGGLSLGLDPDTGNPLGAKRSITTRSVSSGKTIPSGVWTTVDGLASTLSIAQDGSLYAGAGVFSSRVKGLHVFQATLTLADTAPVVLARWRTEGGTVLAVSANPAGTGTRAITCNGMAWLPGGGYGIYLELFQNSGASTTVQAHTSADPSLFLFGRLYA